MPSTGRGGCSSHSRRSSRQAAQRKTAVIPRRKPRCGDPNGNRHATSMKGRQSINQVSVPLQHRGLSDQLGFPPAGARSTAVEVRHGPCRRAYSPLAREHRFGGKLPDVIPGLPPLARGAHRARPRRRPQSGPTPAGAGSTAPGCSSRSVSRAYPRWRGEHGQQPSSGIGSPGLPPLARGAQPVH